MFRMFTYFQISIFKHNMVEKDDKININLLHVITPKIRLKINKL